VAVSLGRAKVALLQETKGTQGKMGMTRERRILLVDDNPQYRAAAARNLTLAGYQVIEAEDSAEGMEKIHTGGPHVVITDLDMRTHDEGLLFIRELKRLHPRLPVVMISAVGTFDEGALARQYGATFVLSKSRIDAEISTFYQRLEHLFELLERIEALRNRVDEALAQDTAEIDALRQELEDLLRDDDLDAGLKGEIYDLADRLDRSQARAKNLRLGLDAIAVPASLEKDLPGISRLDAETRTMLAVAESMQQSGSAATLSVARNVSFSYSFAVENEVKLRVGRKVSRLLTEERVKALACQLYDTSLGNLDLFFNQYLIRQVQHHALELNSDITRQVLERILQHGSKYKPDGLKALGVILFCWGRNHSFINKSGPVEIQNPLGIKGLTDDQTTRLASQLILLQHIRNPYIHPEFNEREKIESVRKTALDCLSLVSHVV